MKEYKITGIDGHDTLAKAGVKIGEHLDRISAKEETVVFAVPGGRSASGVFTQLAQENVDWDKVRIYMVDERRVQFEDEDGILNEDLNYAILEEDLIRPLEMADKINRKNVHPYRYLKEEEDSGLGDYEQELLDDKGKFDVVFVSAGEDGHIAGLFPHHETIQDGGLFFIKTDESPKAPPLRMSASRKLILGAQVGFIAFIGESKREAYEKFYDDSVGIEECPAKIIRHLPEYYVVTDLDEE